MRYGSVCSGIEAATAAWHGLGWEPQWFAEIEPFPSAVLAHHYPTVPNLGDFTKIGVDSEPIDLLVGGTPCQSFSVAGKRLGMDDPRGNLAIEFLRLAYRKRARWFLFENVPGLLSSAKGEDFAAFLSLATGTFVRRPKGGWKNAGVVRSKSAAHFGVCYRILDAQYFGVAQRRRRVFVVGYFGDWRPAAAVLFERESLSGNPPPCRSQRKGTAGGFEVGPGTNRLTDLAPTMDARAKDGPMRNQLGLGVISHPLRAEGCDASEDGTGRGIPLVARSLSTSNQRINAETETFVLQHTMVGRDADAGPGGKGWRDDGVAYTHDSRPTSDVVVVGDGHNPLYYSHDYNQDRIYSTDGIAPAVTAADSNQARNILAPPIGFGANSGGQDATDDMSPTLRPGGVNGGGVHAAIAERSQVRRLTPRECERLQGFPDDYTLVIHKGKPAADGSRYRALGNSMAVPCMKWLGERIEAVSAFLAAKERAA